MDDADLARRAQSGDRAAWATIYDRYADRLHDYCWSILRDHHEAEDALQDSFVTAASRIGQLRDPAALRPWLYSICRTSALGRARRRGRVVPTEAVGDVIPAAPDTLGPDPEIGELQRVVWDAAAGLSPRDRAVLELHLRHELVGQELGDALGVSAHHATVLLARVRDLVERSLGALLVGRTGRRDCPELDTLLQGWDGRLSPLVRKRVARHIDGCDVCGERRRSMVSPVALLAAAPLVPAPADLRARVLDAVDHAPPGDGPRGRGRRTVAAAVAVVALVVGVVVLVQSPDDQVAVDGTPDTTATPLTSPTSTSTTTTTATPDTIAIVPGTTERALATPPHIVVVSPPVDLGAAATAAVARFRNDGGQPLEWTVAADLPGLTLAPTAGTLAPGAIQTLVVALDRGPLAEGVHDGAIRVVSGSLAPGTVAVAVRVERAPTIAALAIDRASISFIASSSCRLAQVSAEVQDESGVTSVLRWRRSGSTTVEEGPMLPASDGRVRGFVGPALSPSDGPLTWWIEATDARGNSARTLDRTLAVTAAC